VADHYQEFQGLGVEVIAISTDSIYAHKIFAQSSPSLSKVTYPILSDHNQQIAQTYQVLNKDTGTANRAVIIISPEGLIKCILQYPNSVGRSIPELIRVIQALQFTQGNNKGAPANWQPNNEGLTIQWETVGKI